ncbi:MAG: hypothetical protein ACRDA3_05255 [Peptostreptococcaceae bacterium]
MKRTNGRYFFYEENIKKEIINKKIEETQLISILEEEYNNIFISEKSYYIKNNIYKFNKNVKQRIAQFVITGIFNEVKLTNEYLSIYEYNIAIIISNNNDSMSFINCEDYSNYKNSSIDYFIFMRFNKEMSSPIRLNIKIDKLKNIEDIKEDIAKKNYNVSIIGQLSREELDVILTKERLIPAKSTVNNIKVIDKPTYYIKDDDIKEIDYLISKMVYNHSDKSETISSELIEINNKLEIEHKENDLNNEQNIIEEITSEANHIE